MSTGDATFATSNPHCAYVFNAYEEFYDRIFEAWSASPYGDYFRPVYVDVEGDFDPNSDPDKPQVFHVETVRSVTINFTEAQAKRAFELRMGPRSWQRTKERSEQPANGRASPTPFL